jgi:outer membrane receptor protein involved in Fe transport
MGYRARWHATDQVPRRAIEQGDLDRFGTLDRSNGGETSRYSASVEWQRTRNNASTRLVGYGIASDLDLFSNFTFYLDDPEHGDQFRQTDSRLIAGARASHRRIDRWRGLPVQNTAGVQVRHDNVRDIGLYRTVMRQPLQTVRRDRVQQTSGAVYGQNELQWTSWLRTIAGIRLDQYRFDAKAEASGSAGVDYAGRISPKAGVVLGPWARAELYVNAGYGFHSNDARGIVAAAPAEATPESGVTPLAQATGAEVGMRSILIPGLQTTLTLWTLRLDSELVFVGDAGTTEPSRGSRRSGLEWSAYYSPTPWLTLDADVSLSRAEFVDPEPSGQFVPGAVGTVVAAGATIDRSGAFGSVRWRYFGPRPLIEDNSARSAAAGLVNMAAGFKFSRTVRLAVDVFNVLDAKGSDVDYFYSSRLPGEQAEGVEDIHFHPALPRTARLNLIIGF